ncbi:putative transposase/invertase (TIGR01784 family) [Thermoanaerobacter pentosaceus]|uniref:Transposase/invertase (TIGR01784 family) n=2 Tax=Thermoanaerobacter pentosaceus TaxID=694059 RepID=A0ABT9M5P0_9THEO|nr:putative transposase/invertase (TIGR01784 family) [Thermoanaerobacter pentosaceus]
METDKNKKNLNAPHDKGYKYLLSHKKVFIELLRSFVKKDWVNEIDESKVIRINKSFILQDFKNKEADLVYQVKLKDKEVFFYILLELQSKVDFQMPYRLLLYIIEVWREILKDTSLNQQKRKDYKLPAIIPIVLYNGVNRWTAPLSFKETIDSYQLFGENIIDFKYILIDVNRYSEEELLQLSNLIGSVFLLDRRIDREELIERLKKLTDVLKNLSEEEFILLRNWFMSIISRFLPEGKRKEVKKIFEKSEGVEKMISNLERSLKEEFKKTRKEGRIEGKKEGKIEGIRMVLLEQLKEKFEDIPFEYINGLEKLDDKALLALARDILKIEKLDDLRKYIN